MRRPFLIPSALILGAGLALAAAPAVAQSWGHDSGSSHYRGGSNAAPSAFDWRSQLDRPGDYRCDAFWDASRTDCGERWRDQRNRSSQPSWNTGGGYRYDRPGYGQGHGYGQPSWRRGQGSGTAYHGAYGRPDLVYPGGGRADGHGGYGGYGAYDGGRDPGRIDWCRASYRSYDPHTGYYRAYSGQLIFCG